VLTDEMKTCDAPPINRPAATKAIGAVTLSLSTRHEHENENKDSENSECRFLRSFVFLDAALRSVTFFVL
jgi:hypothetical protein